MGFLRVLQFSPNSPKTCTRACLKTVNGDVSVWVTGVCPVMDPWPVQGVILPWLQTSLCDASFWYGFIHGENRDLDREMAPLFLQNICLLWFRMIVCERKHLALLLILIVSCHLSMWHFLVLFSIQGPEIHQHWWVHAPSDISVTNCSLWATIVLFCSLRGAKSQFTSEHRANPGLCVLMSGICCLIELRVIN